jgi:hypothetical protein
MPISLADLEEQKQRNTDIAGRSNEAQRAKHLEMLGSLQEWQVSTMQRNAFKTKKIELILSIDKSRIESTKKRSKRNPSSFSYNVFRRELTSVASIEPVSDDPLSLRIVWRNTGANETPIVYTCENAKDCTEIISKVKGLLEYQ